MKRSSVALEGLGITRSCRDNTHPRDSQLSYLKGVIGNSTKIGPVLEVLVTVHYGRYGIAINADSLAKCASEPWVVISRGVEGYVTELSLDCTEPMYVDTSALDTGKRVAFIPWKVQRCASSPSREDDVCIPIDHRKWEFIRSVVKVIKVCYPISKRMTALLRHFPYLREQDGAVPWGKIVVHFEGFPCQVANWTSNV